MEPARVHRCAAPVIDSAIDSEDPPHAQASALGPEDCSGAVDKRKAQRVAWDAESDVSNLLSQPPLRVADQASAAQSGSPLFRFAHFSQRT